MPLLVCFEALRGSLFCGLLLIFLLDLLLSIAIFDEPLTHIVPPCGHMEGEVNNPAAELELRGILA
jgi:hypothetical protein